MSCLFLELSCGCSLASVEHPKLTIPKLNGDFLPVSALYITGRRME